MENNIKYRLVGLVEIENEPFEFSKGINEYYLWMKTSDKGVYLSTSIYNTEFYPEEPEFLFEKFGGENLVYFGRDRKVENSEDFKSLINDYFKIYLNTDINHGSYIHPIIESRIKTKIRLKGQKEWFTNE